MKLQQKTIEKLRKLINEETEYRSGPILVRFFNNIGFNDSYGQGFPSRWAYTEDRLTQINGTDRMEKCIQEIFAPVNFIGKFEELDKLISDFNQYLSFDNYKIIRNGQHIEIVPTEEDAASNSAVLTTENDFLKKEFKEVSIVNLKLDETITSVLEQRLDEIKKCLNSKASLAVIFLCGSTLEGILLGIASNNPKKFNTASSSPKDKQGKVLPFHDWTLGAFIDVAKEVGYFQEDVKKFSHSLRDFRNYIHPYEQLCQNFNPSEHTAKLCWQVLKLAIYQLTKSKNDQSK